MLTVAQSRAVSELYAILEIFLLHRNWRNADFSARWRNKSNIMADSERQLSTSYLQLMLTFALSRTVSMLYTIFANFIIKPEVT